MQLRVRTTLITSLLAGALGAQSGLPPRHPSGMPSFRFEFGVGRERPVERPIDFNGDGIDDLWARVGGGFIAYVAILDRWRREDPARSEYIFGSLFPSTNISGTCWAFDIDSDGDTDFLQLQGVTVPEPFTVHSNDGQGNFTVEPFSRFHPVLPPNRTNRSFLSHLVLPFDLDQDGDLDVIVFNTGIAIYENDGTGHFSPKPEIQVGTLSDLGWLLFFDANGDGLIDILAPGNVIPEPIHILHNVGGLRFQNVQQIHTGNDQVGRAAADIDGDGDIDALCSSFGPTLNRSLLINDGNGFFTDESAARIHYTRSPPRAASNCDFVDWNEDGHPDLVLNSIAGTQFFLNDGTGHFHEPPFDPMRGAPDSFVQWFWDVDEDGDVDIIPATGGVTYWNLYRDILPIGQPTRGQPFRVDLTAPDGELGILHISAQSGVQSVPGLGDIIVAGPSIIAWPQAFFFQGGPLTATLPVPNNPAIQGLDLTLQAAFANLGTGSLHLSRAELVTVQ